MAKGSGASVLAILLIGGLAVAVLFGSAIINFVSGLPSWLENFIAKIEGSLPGSGGDISGQTWIGYTVTYTDGTSEDIRQEAPTFSLLPLSITFKNKVVSQVRVDLKAKLSCSESMGSWSGVVSMQTEIYKGSEHTPKTSATANYTPSGASWSDGTTKILATYTVSASTLEQLVDTYGDGAWSLQFLGSVVLTVNVGGADIELSAASPAGTMTFNYAGGSQTSLSVTGDSKRVS